MRLAFLRYMPMTDPTDQSDIAKSVLVEGETLLWVGAPDRLRRTGSTMGSTSIMFLILAMNIFHGDLFMLVAGITGLAALIGMFIANYRGSRGILYGITNRRVFIITDGRPETLVSFYSIDPEELELHGLRSDGSGTLVIKKLADVKIGDNWKSVQIELIAIPDVQGVVRILKDTFSAPKSSIA